MSCALLGAFPALAPHLPHRPLGDFPTPIERLAGLLPDVDLWVKREDLAAGPQRAGHPSGYGGNKVRKLEFLLGGAAPGERVITFGGYGSHHVLATGIYGSALGLDVAGVVFPQPATPHARATAAQSAGCARLYPCAGYLDLPWQLLRALFAPGPRGRTRLIGIGGSSALGTLGWVSGGLEIAAQVAAGQAPRFDAVYVALGSCGTAAGLFLGLGQSARELVAVRVAPAAVCNRARTLHLARRCASLLRRYAGPGATLPPPPALRVDGRFLGAGYGQSTPAAEAAVRRGAAAGLLLETTYTGKVLAALCADAEAGLLRGRQVLFVHSASAVTPPPAEASLPPRLRRWCR